jgi:hypothetical protein
MASSGRAFCRSIRTQCPNSAAVLEGADASGCRRRSHAGRPSGSGCRRQVQRSRVRAFLEVDFHRKLRTKLELGASARCSREQSTDSSWKLSSVDCQYGRAYQVDLARDNSQSSMPEPETVCCIWQGEPNNEPCVATDLPCCWGYMHMK